MASNYLNSDLSKILALRKDDQKYIIKQLTEVFRQFGVRGVEEWQNPTGGKKNRLLHELVEKDWPEIIIFVIKEHKLNINIRRESDGNTPFQVASDEKNFKMCDLLKKLGAEAVEVVDCSKLQADDKEEKERAMNIVWIDLEMTSIEDPEILECAVIITDKNLKELTHQEWVIHFDESVLKGLANWHQKTFADINAGGNGLFADILRSKLTKDDVEEELLALLKRYCPEGKCPLAGSSIHIDKEVLKKEMPKVHNYLHYRIIDVSSFQGIMKRWAPWIDKKIRDKLGDHGQETVNHRAMDDIKWSISVMKEFRPILVPPPQNHAGNRKNEPFIQQQQNELQKHHRQKEQPMNNHQKETPGHYHHKETPAFNRQRSNGSSSIARNVPQNGINRAADNRPQFYADEKRLLERIEYEKTVNVKRLNLDKQNQEIYDANPHLRELFINKQQLVVYEKKFTAQNRFLKLSSKRLDNDNCTSERISTTEHWGQRKLLLTEIEFLTNYAGNDKYLVVYAGAAPGTHINYLSKLFPHLDFHLFDANEFCVTRTEAVQTQSEKFSDKFAKQYGNSNNKILFICNVRTFNPNTNPDESLTNDMLDQMEWHKSIKPRASLLNFRLPRTPSKTQYLEGELVIEPWASRRSTECRLIVDKDRRLTNYDQLEFENSLLRFQSEKRIKYYEHNMDVIETEGLDHCYDCRAEIFILQEYLTKIGNVTDEIKLKKQTANMSYDISREIVDKNRESCIGVTRTLSVIPKKPTSGFPNQ